MSEPTQTESAAADNLYPHPPTTQVLRALRKQADEFDIVIAALHKERAALDASISDLRKQSREAANEYWA